LTQIKAELLDYMGDDLAVVDAARVSFNKTSEWVVVDGHEKGKPEKGVHVGAGVYRTLSDGDQKLIKFLATHDHWTPFAHTALKFRVAAPVPIRTQCFKHKIGMVENEESRRYISTTPEIFVPEFFRAKPEGSIKQGSGEKHKASDAWRSEYDRATRHAVSIYEMMIEDGLCPEQARFILPQGAIVNWIWTGNLVSFANFYNKRTEATAQYEVRLLAESVGEKIAELFPVSWEALTGGD
jgi:thymidylate synthase (FAD)